MQELLYLVHTQYTVLVPLHEMDKTSDFFLLPFEVCLYVILPTQHIFYYSFEDVLRYVFADLLALFHLAHWLLHLSQLFQRLRSFVAHLE